MQRTIQTAPSAQSVISTNKVLRNTYSLLSMTLLFSALMAFVAVKANWPIFSPFVFLIGAFGLMFLTNRLANSAWGLVSVFAFTGFFGAYVGPYIGYITQAYGNGQQIVMLALAGTGITFLGLSGIALTTKRDFSGMAKFLMVGVLVAFLAGVANIFLGIPALSLAVSSMFCLLMCGMILYQTQQIVNGGETNYIIATIGLFVTIYNLFMSLLNLLMFFMGED